MKTKHTRKQIENALKFWKKVLAESTETDEAMSIEDIMKNGSKFKVDPNQKYKVDDGYIKKVIAIIRQSNVREAKSKIDLIQKVLESMKGKELKADPYEYAAQFIPEEQVENARRVENSDRVKDEFSDTTGSAFGNDDAEANMYDSEMYEAEEDKKVTDEYIKTATTLLAELKEKNPEAYAQALKYLNYQKGRYLAVTAEEFAANRIKRATTPEETKPTQSRDELIASVGQRKKEEYDQLDKPHEPKRKIKSIWIKKIHINKGNEKESFATLEYEFADGTKEEVQYPIGTVGGSGSYIDRDELYRECYRNLKGSKLAKQTTITDADVRIACIRVTFTSIDSMIEWFYGPNRSPDPLDAQQREEIKQLSKSGRVISAAKAKAKKDPRFVKVILRDLPRGGVIYKMEKVDDDA